MGSRKKSLRKLKRRIKEKAYTAGRAWKEAGPALRITAKVMWPLGVALAALGILGDLNGWWTDRSFLTNLLSSLTGVLFGIPFALIVLQQVAAHQAEQMERTVFKRLARREFSSITEALDRLYVRDDESRLQQLEDLLKNGIRALQSHAEDADDEPRRRHDRGGGDVARDSIEDRVRSVARFDEALTLWKAVIEDQEKCDRLWESALRTARYIDDHIGPRYLELDIPWVPAADRGGLSSTLERWPAFNWFNDLESLRFNTGTEHEAFTTALNAYDAALEALQRIELARNVAVKWLGYIRADD
ncbi:hypothetical protein [Nonomuraea sp. CA-141351]|uniref:hypothetical protein n=1 Tax=Nonomuraea sp. CA-141351 TaxID=3239996 RepID=UPI003D8AF6B9